VTPETSPLFSVVTVCLNAEPHIAEAIDSVLDQGFDDFEYVAVDGGSTDGTLELVRERAATSSRPFRWVSEADEGLFDAMNKGLALARGQFVVYVGADDRLLPGALEAVARASRANQAAGIVCGGARVTGPHGGWDEPASVLVRRGMPQRAPSRHQSIFVRVADLRAVGGFDVSYRIAADYDAYLKLVEAGASQELILETLSEFRLGGVSSRNALATAREYRDVRVAHGANPTVERIVMHKSAMAARLHAGGMRVRASLRGRDV